MTDENNQKEKWEYASIEWCQFAAGEAVRLLKKANIDPGKYIWGFSEEYTHTPERLMAGREKAGFQVIIKDGEIRGGNSVTEECLALPGYHVSVDWGFVAHGAATIYDEHYTQKGLTDDIIKLAADLRAAGYGPKKSTKQVPEKPAEKKEPRCSICGSPEHDSENCPVWPPGIREAFSDGGLHNLTASRIKRSPELDDLPETEYGVAVFSKMNDEQKERFIKLLGR